MTKHQQNVDELRYLLIQLAAKTKCQHLASSLSCVELLYFIMLERESDDSKVVVSKGHAAMAYYAALIKLNKLKVTEFLDEYSLENSKYFGHLSRLQNSEIDWSTGALGHGAGAAVGMALSVPERQVYVLLSDGELNCGSNWEAFFLAQKLKLKNITFIIDANGSQGIDFEHAVYGLNSKVQEMIKTLGMNTATFSGHNVDQVEKAVKEAKEFRGASFLIGQTIKGKGVASLEGKVESHYVRGSKKLLEEYERSICR